MAGLGLGPADFAMFEIDDPDERANALEGTLLPKLVTLGEGCRPGLGRVVGRPLFLHAVRLPRRKGVAPEELRVGFSESSRGLRGVPQLSLVASRGHLHARVAVRGESPGRAAMRGALEREAPNLARKGKPFRRLRAFHGWNHEELPELAPAHSPAFWVELGDELAPGREGFDVGVSWTRDEARSLALGDLLGVFRDLAPLYKVLAAAAAHRPPVTD